MHPELRMDSDYRAPRSPDIQAFPLPWRNITKIAFRFAFVYFGLYTSEVVLHLLGFPPFLQISRLYEGLRWHVVVWVSKHILQLSHDFGTDFLIPATGSKDSTYSWVQILLYLFIAAMATVIWSLFDRHRREYAWLHEWFLVYVRLCLAIGLIGYGAPKLVPAQFPPPSLSDLMSTVGSFRRDSFLWVSTGVAPIYSLFGGLMEVVPALLLVVPRLATAGALLSIATMTNVLMLNLGYEIGAKSLAINMLLMGVVIVLPEAPRLVNFFVLNQETVPRLHPPLFQRLWLNRAAVVLQIAFGVVLLSYDFYSAHHMVTALKAYRSTVLYGIWSVDDYEVNGAFKPPLSTDPHRWQRLIFDSKVDVFVQVMTGDSQYLFARVDPLRHSLVLTEPRNAEWIAELNYDDSHANFLVLTGKMGGLPVLIRLHRIDDSKFPINDHAIHWVRDASGE